MTYWLAPRLGELRPIVRHAFHLLLPKTTLSSVAVRAFAGWIKASLVALGEDHDKPETWRFPAP